MSKPSTGARYYAGPFDEVELVSGQNRSTVKWGDPAPPWIDVDTLPPDWLAEKPRGRHTPAHTVTTVPEEA